MSRPDEGLIHTYLDGECTPDEAARIEALIASDPEWAAAVAEARGLVAASSRILSALDATPGGVLPAGNRASGAVTSTVAGGAAAVRSGDRPRFRLKAWHRAAAVLVLVVGTSYAVNVARNGDLVDTPATNTQPAAKASEAGLQTEAADASPPDAAAASAISPGETNRVSRAASSGAPAGAAPATATTAGSAVAANTAVPTAEPRRERLADSGEVSAAAVAAAAVSAQREALRTQAAASGVRAESEARERAGAQRLAAPAVAPASQALVATKAPAAAPALRRDAAAEATADAAGAGGAALVARLDGCWLVSSPDTARGLLRSPTILRQVGDTLVIQLSVGATVGLRAVRSGGVLRGELTAVQAPCPTP